MNIKQGNTIRVYIWYCTDTDSCPHAYVRGEYKGVDTRHGEFRAVCLKK